MARMRMSLSRLIWAAMPLLVFVIDGGRRW
jgi:hypothetical protein